VLGASRNASMLPEVVRYAALTAPYAELQVI
jgi:hypothetical protein